MLYPAMLYPATLHPATLHPATLHPAMINLPPIDRAALVATRRDLHQHPELGFEERRTGTLVAERLKALGYSVRTGVGRTGVVGLRDGATGSCVLVRADMDALRSEEHTSE